MKIACWNVNSVRARLPQVLDWVSQTAPDIVLLQELKCVEESFPASFFEDLGYNMAIFGQKTYNGVAILSKYPLDDIRRGLPGQPNADDARYIEAFTNGMRIASVYVPNGMDLSTPKFDIKMAFYDALEHHLNSNLKDDTPFVVGGDFNVAPFGVDVYDRAILEKDRLLTSLSERSAFRRLLQLGYTDGLRSLFPAQPAGGDDLFTWWDYRAGSFPRNKGFRIDHFLLSPRAADHLIDGGVDLGPRGQERPSDHAPLWITMKSF